MWVSLAPPTPCPQVAAPAGVQRRADCGRVWREAAGGAGLCAGGAQHPGGCLAGQRGWEGGQGRGCAPRGLVNRVSTAALPFACAFLAAIPPAAAAAARLACVPPSDCSCMCCLRAHVPPSSRPCHLAPALPPHPPPPTHPPRHTHTCTPIPQDFYANFDGDPLVKIPWVRRDLSGPKVLVMEWIDGIR